MNNKGVTLIELLVVIVVIGIISAFAVPAVGNFIDTAKQQAVYQDAIAVRNAAAFYCAQPDASATRCAYTTTAVYTDNTYIRYSDINELLDGFDDGNYETGNNRSLAARWGTEANPQGYRIFLEHNGTGDYEWNDGQGDPAESDASAANVD